MIMRIIKTARDQESINQAALQGLKPLVKPVIPSEKITSKYAVVQSIKTGEIEVIGDYRASAAYPSEEFETVIDWTFYNPYKFNSPFAAYLVPPDINLGERVLLEDLIEDFVGSQWNQGDTFRLESCEAVWNGTDFEIQYDPNQNKTDIIG